MVGKPKFKKDELIKYQRGQCVGKLLDLYMNSANTLYFFDITSINEKGFSKKRWLFKSYRHSYSGTFYYNATHILMPVSTLLIESIFVYRGNLSKELVAHLIDLSKVESGLGKCWDSGKRLDEKADTLVSTALALHIIK